MAVKPYQWGLDQKKDKRMTDVINQGRKQHGAEKFDAILESQYGIKKSDYMGDSYNKLVSTAQTGGKQAVDKLYKTNTSSITSSQSRNPITAQSNPGARNILPGTQISRYGDTGGAINTPKYSGKGVGVTYSNVRLSDVTKNGSAFLWNERAKQKEQQSAGYLTMRNDFLANAFYNDGIDSREGIANYLNQFGDFANASQGDKDNTITAIWNRIGEINKRNTDTYFDQKGKYDLNSLAPNADPNQANSNQLSDSEYWEFVNTTLKTNFDQFGDLNALKETYGDEAFYKLKEFLTSAKGAYDITNPEERNRLAGDMQKMLGTFIGNQSDLSKLNLNMESGLSLFSPESQTEIKTDLEKMGQLEGMGMNAQQIADRLGWTTDKVYQLNLLKQGHKATRLGKYYDLSDTEKTRLSEETDIARQRLKEDHELAMQRQDRDLQRLTETHQKNYERQKRQNEINEGNANMLAGLTGIGFSSRGIQGLQEIQTQAKEILDDMTTKYERGKIQINDIKMDLMMAYERKDADLVRQLNESLVQAKNAYISGVAQLQSKYGLVSMEGQKALAEATKGFIESAQKIYMDASTNARANLKSLIDAKTDLMNYEYKQLEYTNAKKKQFMSESMYMTPQMAMQYAQEHGFADQIDEVLNYQMQATVNTLESYAPGSGMKYQGEIQAMLNKGYTPAQTISNLMQRADFTGISTGKNKSYAPITITENTRGVYDPNSGKVTYFDQGGSSIFGETTNHMLEDFIANNPVGSVGGECGTFAKKYLGWQSFPNEIEEKIKKTTSKVAQVGSVAVVDWSKSETATEKQKKYGHVGIVVSINDDGTTTLFDSNGSSDHKVGYTKVPTHRIAGYIESEGNKLVNNQKFDHYFNMISFPNAKMSSNSKSELQRIIKNSGSEEQIRNKFMTIVEKTMGVDAGGKLKSRRDLGKNLNSIKNLLTQLQKEGIEPGFFSGKLEKLANKVGQTQNSKIKSLATALQNELDALMRSRTGAAINASEEVYYNRLFPNEGKSLQLNMADIDGLLYSNTYQIQNSFANIFDEEFAQWLYPSQQKEGLL